MGGMCTCCRRKIPKDQHTTIKYHGSFLRRKASISAAFSVDVPGKSIDVTPSSTAVNNNTPDSSAPIPVTLDINTATEEDFMTLPNIGRAVAHNIVEYRKQIGAFNSVEDLVLVNGIGAGKLAKLRKEIHVSSNVVRFKRTRTSNGNVGNIVNINSASMSQLMTINGVTDELAVKIIEYRSENGKYHHINDLVEPARLMDITMLLKLKPFLAVDRIFGRHSRNASSSSSKLKYSSSGYLGSGPESLDSTREKVEPFSSVRFGRPVVRIATWNLDQCCDEKITNPGVRETICATILENGIKILVVQDILDGKVLQKIVDELHNPTLPNIQRLKSTSSWECVFLPTLKTKSHEKYTGFIYDKTVNIILRSCSIIETSLEGEHPAMARFKVEDLDISVVCVNLGPRNASVISDEESLHITEMLSSILQQAEQKHPVFIVGDFGKSANGKEFDVLRNDGYAAIVPASVPTDISTKMMKGSQSKDNIWMNQEALQTYTSNYHVVRSGLANPWIPDGWSWGGVVSSHCPVWAEIFVDGNDVSDDTS